jgi:hypothetical protein
VNEDDAADRGAVIELRDQHDHPPPDHWIGYRQSGLRRQGEARQGNEVGDLDRRVRG